MSAAAVAGAPGEVRVRLPATSANLGPGFDTAGLALSLYLTVDAKAASKDSVDAHGRNRRECGQLRGNLIFESYRRCTAAHGLSAQPLHLRVDNEIPLGMGCGSSAAARLAGILLADAFGQIGLSDVEKLSEASAMEGHPDNAAACLFGGFTVSADTDEGTRSVSFPGEESWQLMLALPGEGVATEMARALLPAQYPRADAVFNVQRVALLTAAFATQRLDLLGVAMQDRLHQPQRRDVCKLLQHLDDLDASGGFAGVALSGAGPALLAVLKQQTSLHRAASLLHHTLGDTVEVLPVQIAGGAAVEVVSRLR